MADKKAKGASNGDASTEKKGPPAGFRRRAAVSEAPWFVTKDGNVCHGKLIGRYMINQEPPRAYYQVELYSPATVSVGRGDDAEEKEAMPGEVINLGETFKLQVLKEVEIPAILAGAEFDVWFEVDKKIKLQGGKTMWVADVQTKQTKAPTQPVRPLPADLASNTDEDEGDSDAPF